MLLKYLLVPLLLFNTSRQPGTPLLSAAELLMNKKWVLSSYGFDENNNNRIDMIEERIEDCEKDDTYEFYTGGTGMMRDNGFSCCNGIDEQTFQWQFINNGERMIMSSEPINITRLTTSELITQKKLSYVKGQVLSLITVYKIKEQHKIN
jgi:hypothetical protein